MASTGKEMRIINPNARVNSFLNKKIGLSKNKTKYELNHVTIMGIQLI